MTNLKINILSRAVAITMPDSEIHISLENSLAQQQIAPVLEWSETLLDGDSVNYEKAEKAVAALGEGWRLATRFEIESLLDLSRHDPAVDTAKHPTIKSKYYWTSTSCKWDEKSAVWVVSFNRGGVGYYSRGDTACVLAVRSSQ